MLNSILVQVDATSSIYVDVAVPSLTDADEPLSYFNIKDLCISNNNITLKKTGEDTAQKTNDECVTITGSLQSTSRKEEDKKDKQTDKTNQKNQEPSQGK